MKYPLVVLTLLAGFSLSGSAHAVLVYRDGNVYGSAIYDTDLNITWWAPVHLEDNGRYGEPPDTFTQATSWAANFSYYNSARKVSYTDWRLPDTLVPDMSCDGSSTGGNSEGYNCIGSEMGHLFYGELGLAAGQSVLASTDPITAAFRFKPDLLYWSGTTRRPGSGAWAFDFASGSQTNSDYYSAGVLMHVLAVHSGDVAGAVPEADTWTLLLSGLVMVGAAARRGHG